MKKYLVLPFAIAILGGCMGCGNSKDGGEETTVEVKTTTFEGTRVYSLPEAENSYLTYKYSIEWPEEINGIDADKFKAFVVENVLDTTGTDIEALIDADCEKFASAFNGVPTTEVTCEQVDELRENYGTYELYPSGEISNEILAYDPDRNIIGMVVISFTDYDTGFGAGYHYYETTVYYDCQRNCKIELSDIVGDKDKVLAAVKRTAIDKAEELCVDENAVNSLTELPDRFTIGDLGLSFTFAPYEIACGASGNLEIQVQFNEVLDCLTPMGKKLFVGETTLEEVKTEAETMTSEFITNCLDYENSIPDAEKMKEYFSEEYTEANAKWIDDGIGWLDYDPWIDAQDFDDVSFTVKNVYTVSKDKAIVELEVKNFGSVQSKYLVWKRQDGKLKLDDYTTSGTTIRTIMRNSL